MFSETEIELFMTLMLTRVAQKPFSPRLWEISTMTPVATLTTLIQSVPVGQSRTQTRTHGSEVQEAGDGNGPEVLGEDRVTTIELEGELELDTWASGLGIK